MFGKNRGKSKNSKWPGKWPKGKNRKGTGGIKKGKTSKPLLSLK